MLFQFRGKFRFSRFSTKKCFLTLITERTKQAYVVQFQDPAKVILSVVALAELECTQSFIPFNLDQSRRVGRSVRATTTMGTFSPLFSASLLSVYLPFWTFCCLFTIFRPFTKLISFIRGKETFLVKDTLKNQ